MITAKKAKKLTLEVWRYLRDHPEICEKKDLPDNLYKKIKSFICECPLCEAFKNVPCNNCPLKYCETRSKVFSDWKWAKTDKARQQAAAKIVELVEAWEV